VLRGSMPDEQKRARVSAIYNIFAFVMMIVFVMILPRMSASLHPGNGGNPAFGKYDMDNTMRTVFYPACVGWILIGIWVFQIRVRIEKIKRKLLYDENI
jgi:heme exporter protein C